MTRTPEGGFLPEADQNALPTLNSSNNTLPIPGISDNQPTGNDPMAIFYNRLAGSLQAAQGLGDNTQNLANKGALEEEQIKAGQTTPDSLIGASPQQQAQVRNANQNAITPSIKNINDRISLNNQTITRFAQMLSSATQFGEAYAKHIPASQEVIESTEEMIRAGLYQFVDPEVLKKVASKIPVDAWQAGYDKQLVDAKNPDAGTWQSITRIDPSTGKQYQELYNTKTGPSSITQPGVDYSTPSPTDPTQQTPSGSEIPTGYEQINGAQYNTTASQQAAYDDIRVSQDGTFLYGKPKGSTASTAPPVQSSPTQTSPLPSPTPTSTNTIKEFAPLLDTAFKDNAGPDGFVSPQTYTNAKEEWRNLGLPMQYFDGRFAKYRNPENPNYQLGL